MITYITQWSTSMMDTVGSALVKLEVHFWLYVPLGLIGVWRWLTWGFKRACAEYYKPIDVQPCSPRLSLCIITPVYNENPEIFRKALDSWESNSPDEIIAVIDRSDKSCIEVYNEFSRNKEWAKLLVTAKRGKRQAIVDGVSHLEVR